MENEEIEKVGAVYRKLRNYLLDEAMELGLEARYVYGYENESGIEMPVTFSNNSYSISLAHSNAGTNLIKTMTIGSLRELEALEQILEDEDLRKLYVQELLYVEEQEYIELEVEQEREREAA